MKKTLPARHVKHGAMNAMDNFSFCKAGNSLVIASGSIVLVFGSIPILSLIPLYALSLVRACWFMKNINR